MGIMRFAFAGASALARRVDIKIYPPEQYAYALLYFTGSDHFNRSMRHLCSQKGYSLSDHGLVHTAKLGRATYARGTTNLVAASDEADIFAALGLEYVAPVDRNCDVRTVPGPGAAAAAALTFAGGADGGDS